MEFNLKQGSKVTIEREVTEEDTAAAFGSGNIRVLATPMMIAFMETAALHDGLNQLPEGWSTVGTMVNIKHIAATPVGMKVRAEAELLEIDGKKLLYKVTVYDEEKKVGEGLHGRYIIHEEQFLKKANAI